MARRTRHVSRTRRREVSVLNGRVVACARLLMRIVSRLSSFETMRIISKVKYAHAPIVI